MVKPLSNVRIWFKRHVALPSEHGSWVFLLSPLVIGICAAGRWTPALPYLIVAIFAAFLLRQPITIAVKVYSRRRPKHDLPAAWFWISVYSCIAVFGLVGLIVHRLNYLLILVIPGVLVFIWHLYLVSKRAERRQAGVEIIASGVLALTAPAAYWVSLGTPDSMGRLLWILTWLQSAASIVYAYLRLEQRELSQIPSLTQRIRLGARALIYSTFNLFFVILLSVIHLVPPILPLAYAIQWIETLYGTYQPAIAMRPTVIGLRQLIVSLIFTSVFILAWKLG